MKPFKKPNLVILASLYCVSIMGAAEDTVTASWTDLKLTGKQRVRYLWRQNDLGIFTDKFEATLASNGVVLVRVFPAP